MGGENENGRLQRKRRKSDRKGESLHHSYGGKTNGEPQAAKRRPKDDSTSEQKVALQVALTDEAPALAWTPKLLWRHDPQHQRQISGLAVTAEGNFVLPDPEKGNVKIYDPNMVHMATLGVGTSKHRLWYAWDVSMTPCGNIAVTDKAGKQVKIFNSEGKCVQNIRQKLHYPYGIAVDEEGQSFVSDIQTSVSGEKIHKINIYDREGKFLRCISDDVTSVGYVAARGEHVVFSGLGVQIRVYDKKSGKLLFKYDEEGDGTEKFREASPVCIDASGRILIGCTPNRLTILTSSGDLLRHVELDDDIQPAALAITSGRQLLIGDFNGSIFAFKY